MKLSELLILVVVAFAVSALYFFDTKSSITGYAVAPGSSAGLGPIVFVIMGLVLLGGYFIVRYLEHD